MEGRFCCIVHCEVCIWLQLIKIHNCFCYTFKLPLCFHHLLLLQIILHPDAQDLYQAVLVVEVTMDWINLALFNDPRRFTLFIPTTAGGKHIATAAL